jgi:hypothetical protein
MPFRNVFARTTSGASSQATRYVSTTIHAFHPDLDHRKDGLDQLNVMPRAATFAKTGNWKAGRSNHLVERLATWRDANAVILVESMNLPNFCKPHWQMDGLAMTRSE